MTHRLAFLIVLAGLAGAWGGVASAYDRPGLFLEPQFLPPDARPGECVTRRVTGPGGAYRWDRVECEPQAVWSGLDHGGYGQRPLEVMEGPPRGDRQGGWRPGDQEAWSHGSADHGYGYGDQDDGYAAYPVYRVAGRDAWGYLVWPGKQP